MLQHQQPRDSRELTALGITFVSGSRLLLAQKTDDGSESSTEDGKVKRFVTEKVVPVAQKVVPVAQQVAEDGLLKTGVKVATRTAVRCESNHITCQFFSEKPSQRFSSATSTASRRSLFSDEWLLLLG